MLEGTVPEDVLILKEASMWDRPGVAGVRRALQNMGGLRGAELREYGAEYLLDVELFAPTYNGAEGVWSDDSLSWIAFASHEGTVALGWPARQRPTRNLAEPRRVALVRLVATGHRQAQCNPRLCAPTQSLRHDRADSGMSAHHSPVLPFG
jgi:hypothetical protein